jgi:hypothetical protein
MTTYVDYDYTVTDNDDGDPTVKLPEDIKTKWIAALRSGEFKQTTGYLCTTKGHCCLGVLAEIMGGTKSEDTFIEEYHTDPAAFYKFTFDINSNTFDSMLPDGLYGLPEEVMDDLAGKNDNGMTFDDIANHIEANF